MLKLKFLKKPASLAAVTLSSYINAGQPSANMVEQNVNTGGIYAAIASSAIPMPPSLIFNGPQGAGIQAAILSPDDLAQLLDLSVNPFINSPFLSKIQTESLNGNNLKFAKYINKNASRKAALFVTDYLNGTLGQALAHAAPTRNAFSLYTAENNLFYLSTGLSNHLHNRSQPNRETVLTSISAMDAKTNQWEPEELLTSIALQTSPKKTKKESKNNCVEEIPESSTIIWFEALGALAYQDAQNQTPGFHPSTGGVILAAEGKVAEHVRIGGGATYLYTHIHESHKSGHSNINQEDLFIYASWENKQFYVDGSLLGGLFQINQVRNIKIAGVFDFKSRSKPHGWQLLPHLEFGYHYINPQGVQLTINPLIMVDWANAWQDSYKEKGSGPFNAGQKSHHSSLLRSEVSLRFYETVFFDSWNLIFQEKAGYVNVHSFSTGKVNAFLVGSPGSFTVETLKSSQNLGVAEFAIIFESQKSAYPTGTIFYQGEFGVHYQSHQVAFELAWKF